MKKNRIKITLDMVMLGLLALLYNSHVTVMAFHEIAGLTVCGLVVLHCLLNLKWITTISKRFFNKSLAWKTRIGYAVNCLLAVIFSFALISGICTSQVLFPADSHGSAWRAIHHFCAALSLIFVGVHIGLHWSFAAGMFKKLIPLKVSLKKILAIVLLALVFAFGVYNTAASGFAGWLTEPFVSQVKTEQHTPEHGDEEKDKTSDNNGTASKTDDAVKTVDTNALTFVLTIGRFVSVMAVFATLTYYTEKIIKKKKKQDKTKPVIL